MNNTIEQLLGIAPATTSPENRHIDFSLIFFSDIRTDISNKRKYDFIRDLVIFGDKSNFIATYFPERHFHEFGAIFANPALLAAYLIPQTSNIRFRTAGISLPLHHPAEIVEWWAMNDILSGGRIDLGFGSGWHKTDFIYAPDNYDDRRAICSAQIPLIQELWQGEEVKFTGPDGIDVAVKIHPQPLQKQLNIWLLVSKSDEGFRYAGRKGYNVFTMLYGNNLSAMADKIAIYRQARQEAGLDPHEGKVTLMLHTLIHPDVDMIRNVVEKPFKAYIKSALDAHIQAVPTELGLQQANVSEAEKAKMLDYAYHRYFNTAALFGSVDDGHRMIAQAKSAGVDEIACLMDFGVDYPIVMDSLKYLKQLTSHYHKKGQGIGIGSGKYE
ncbi:MAG: natural product biosynthesis luciferase-like monooxygenase protein [Phenylobacterium sp.]|jgi:natural product biosynthesis luciferase-like monooxygenase protein